MNQDAARAGLAAVRADFPIFRRAVHGRPLVYLDNAATTQKPRQVLDAIVEFYTGHYGSVHRGVYQLSEEATDRYEQARERVALFIHAPAAKEVVFTKGTTEGLNLLAYSLTRRLQPGDEILLSQLEHHSNLVPWQQLAKEQGLRVKFLEIDKQGMLKPDQLQQLLTKKTKIVSLTHVSNALGMINPIPAIAKQVKDNGSLFVVDGAQSVPHLPVDVTRLGCDFLVFSGHKMLGPTGVGALWGREELLEGMDPFLYGGDMIREVTFERTAFNELPWKFEAGTPNVAGVIGIGAAVDYLQRIGMERIESHEQELTLFAHGALQAISNLHLYGPPPEQRAGIVSFNLAGIHAHDLATILDQQGIAIRAGHHCAMPLMSVLGVNGTARASFYLYNTQEEISLLAETLERARKLFDR